jgi:hypothetical protein
MMESVLKHLQQYGWALSPPLWSHEEILLMCIITTDANLQFDGIQQKDKTNVPAAAVALAIVQVVATDSLAGAAPASFAAAFAA